MSAEAFPRAYAITHGEGIALPRPYFVFSMEGKATQVHSYAINTTGSAIEAGNMAQQSYAVLANPASVSGSRSFSILRHDVAVHKAPGYVVMQTFYPPYEDLSIAHPFSENRFPESVSYGSSGGPGFKTSVFGVDSGVANTNAEWERLRARYDVTFDHCPREDIDKVEDFFYAMRGKAIGFRFKDWNDYQIANQNVVVGDGASVSYQLFKRYYSGGSAFDRIITKPVRGTVSSMYVDGVEFVPNRDFFVNYSTGELTFTEPLVSGAVGNLGYIEFDVPVRFDTDRLVVAAEDFNQYSISNLEMIEILT